MKRIFCFLFFYFSMSVVLSQQGWQHFASQAREAYKIGDHKKFYEMLVEANKLHPYHQGLLYQLGLAAALNNKPDDAIAYLTKALQIKADYDLNNPDLISLKDTPAFEKIRQLQRELQTKTITSDTAFIVRDRTAHIESIAKGEEKNIFYLGSIHKRKIVRVDEKNNATDFTSPGQDGLCSVFGIRVDPSKKILWACSSPMAEMENFDSTSYSSVFKYDVKTKKLLGRYSPEKKQEYIFGDLTLDANGNVFVSDSKNNIIFQVDEKNRALTEYFASEEFWNLQGITFSDDGKYLFIADYIRGLFRLELKTKNLLLLKTDFGLSLKSIDGLTYYKNSLIGIQNAIVPMRVTRFFLNATQDRLTDVKILDRAHPAFGEPTIGCLVNDEFYYVANSFWSGYDKDHKQKSADELPDVVILKSDLKK